jgi:hypothetical protein
MENITQADLKIMQYLSKAGGECTGLIRISNVLDMQYHYTTLCIVRMERIGLLQVDHMGNARPMVIHLLPGCPSLPLPNQSEDE